MRRFALLACLLGGGLLLSCEDDSAYLMGPSTFQNDTLDGAAGAPANMDAGADMAGAAGASGPVERVVLERRGPLQVRRVVLAGEKQPPTQQASEEGKAPHPRILSWSSRAQ